MAQGAWRQEDLHLCPSLPTCRRVDYPVVAASSTDIRTSVSRLSADSPGFGGQVGAAEVPASWTVVSPVRDRRCGTVPTTERPASRAETQPCRYKTTIYHTLS